MHCHTRFVALTGLLAVFLVLTATARPQSPQNGKEAVTKTCTHDGYELWDELKMLPVQFVEFDTNTATWRYQDERVVKMGSFALAENAQYMSREEKKVSLPYLRAHKDAVWLCYYCAHCHTLLIAYELKPGLLTFS